MITLAAAVPFVRPTDCAYNVSRLVALARKASEAGTDVTLFPLLCISGATCGDLAAMPTLLNEAERQLNIFLEQTASLAGTFVVSLPCRDVTDGSSTFSGVTPLTVAVSGGNVIARTLGNTPLKLYDDVVLQPAATPDVAGHYVRLRRALIARSETEHKAIIYCNCGFGESTTDHVLAAAPSSSAKDNCSARPNGSRLTNSSSQPPLTYRPLPSRLSRTQTSLTLLSLFRRWTLPLSQHKPYPPPPSCRTTNR